MEDNKIYYQGSKSQSNLSKLEVNVKLVKQYFDLAMILVGWLTTRDEVTKETVAILKLQNNITQKYWKRKSENFLHELTAKPSNKWATQIIQ